VKDTRSGYVRGVSEVTIKVTVKVTVKVTIRMTSRILCDQVIYFLLYLSIYLLITTGNIEEFVNIKLILANKYKPEINFNF